MLRLPQTADVAQAATEDIETALREFGHWIDRALEFVENRYGIGIVERSCLEMLAARTDGCRPGEIADYLRLSVGETSALVSRLVRRGYARREGDAADPDGVTVHAAIENTDVMAIVRARRTVMDGVRENFAPEELAVIARCAGFFASIHPARLAESAEREAERTRAR